MANPTVTVTLAVIFSLFLLTHARIPADPITEYNKPSTASSESETYTIPSTDALQTSNTDLETLGRIGVSVPFTEIRDLSFRPINRHFHHMHKMNRPFLVRLPRGHRCGHHNGKQHVVGPRESVSYGNDMIITSERQGKGKGFDRMDRNRDWYFVKPFDKHLEVNKRDRWTRKSFKNMRHVFRDAYVEMKREEEGGLWNKVRKFVDGLF